MFFFQLQAGWPLCKEANKKRFAASDVGKVIKQFLFTCLSHDLELDAKVNQSGYLMASKWYRRVGPFPGRQFELFALIVRLP